MKTTGSGQVARGAAAAILVAAGRGIRAGPETPKQFRPLGGVPLLARTVAPFAACEEIGRLILVVPEPSEGRRRLTPYLPAGCLPHFVPGGETRQASTAAGLAASGETGLILVHDGVRPFVTPDLIRRVLGEAAAAGAAVPLLPIQETLKRLAESGRVLETVERDRFALAQTPQGFRREVLEEALRLAASEGYVGTDEAELVERLGRPVARVEGLAGNLKITTSADFDLAETMLEAQSGRRGAGGVRVGMGYDIHPLVPGRRLILGGKEILHPAGLSGHSDGDLICHAAIDAILGAAGLPDIGRMFPDTEEANRNASSLGLLAEAARRVRNAGFDLGNLDLVVLAEEPKLSPHLEEIRRNLAGALGCDSARISVKGKRGEGLGFAGRREGMAAHAVALLVSRGEATSP